MRLVSQPFYAHRMQRRTCVYGADPQFLYDYSHLGKGT